MDRPEDLPGRIETPADSLPRKERRRMLHRVRVGRFAFTTQVGQAAGGPDEVPDRALELQLAAMCHRSAVDHYGPVVGGTEKLPRECLFRAWRVDDTAELEDLGAFLRSVNMSVAKRADISTLINAARPGERTFVVVHWFTEPIDGPAAKAATN